MKITVGKNVEQFPDSIFVVLSISHSIQYRVPVHMYLFPEGFPKITEICFEDGINKSVVREICASLEHCFVLRFLKNIEFSSDNRFEIQNIVKTLILGTGLENKITVGSRSLSIPLLKGCWYGETIDLQLSKLSSRLPEVSNLLEKIKSVVFGAAVADAVGVPVEFLSREELEKNPVTDMIGYGTYHMPIGCWSDDTSMSLAALDSLKNGKVDFISIMQNFFDWLHSGKYTPTGRVFDCGKTCFLAIEKFRESNEKIYECGDKNEYSNGNGSLMRIHPFVLFALNNGFKCSKMIDLIHTASALTHGHERSKIACGIYAFVLSELLISPRKKAIKLGLKKAKEYYQSYAEFSHFKALFSTGIFAPPIQRRAKKSIKSSGYVVDTLEAAIWSVLTTNSYKECILKAVNLGEDTDTVAAVAGGIAGALYGYRSIPSAWINNLKKKEEIEELCFEAAYNWSDVIIR